MELNRKLYETELNGEKISLEISQLAHQANAAVLGRHGDTAVLAAVVMSEKETIADYFPLTVDYEERFYAAGKIIGSRFIRREGRPSDEAILSARLIDRTIRPLFDHRLRREVQVVITVLAYDEKNDPDTIALLAASVALVISDIPWNGPVAGIKIQSEDFQAFFSGPEQRINMIEFEGNEIAEEKLIELFDQAQQEINKLINFQKKVIKENQKQKISLNLTEPEPRLKNLVSDFIKDKLELAIKNKSLAQLKQNLLDYLQSVGEFNENLNQVTEVFENEIDRYIHKIIIEKKQRPDNRKLEEIRPLYAEIGLFRRTHGSGLFIRGDTQILAVTTLASPAAEQLIETMEASGRKRFMLHYNFPNFSTGEVGRSRGPGRREIGHGALAAKAINWLIPSKEIFPYTIRIVAETLSSNGSTSMASVCASSLSLMDAGVPIPRHIAGVAMGLIAESQAKKPTENFKYEILTDIQGPEDNYGDMDFKVAGTEKGITAIQMDSKIYGINREIFQETLKKGRIAYIQILEIMNKTIQKPKPQISPFAPTIMTLNIKPEKIGSIIGPGGRTIQSIIAASDNQINIDVEREGVSPSGRTDALGKVFVSGLNPMLVQKAVNLIKQMVHEYQVGEIIEGTVIKILDFGAIIDLGGGQDGMIHVSELKDGFVKKVDDVVKLGDKVRTKIIRAEPDGKIGLSMRNIDKISQ